MTKKMNYGVKVFHSKLSTTNPEGKLSAKTLPELLSTLALPYLLGAKTQIKRYKKATLSLHKQPIPATMNCLHEASTLFEDLNTVVIYTEKCGKTHTYNKLFKDIRNHIRHTVREDLDKKENQRKNKKALELGLDPKLQINIGFDTDAIKVGERVVKLVIIKTYLNWAEEVFFKIINEAKDGNSLQKEKWAQDSF